MIDHLLKFADEATAKADPIVGAYWIAGDDGPGAWRGDICIPAATVTQISTGTVLPYWYLVVALAALDTALADHPGCMLVADRDAANRSEPFILKSALPQEQLADYSVSPVFAGSNYPFG